MKKSFALGFLCALIALCCVAAVVTQSTSIYILNPANDEIPIRVRVPAGKTTPFLEFIRDGTNAFSISAAGVPVSGATSGMTSNVTLSAATELHFVNGVLTTVVPGE